MTDSIWLVIALPLLGALINGLFGRGIDRMVVNLIAIAAVAVSFLVAVVVFIETLVFHDGPVTVELWTWADIGGLNIPVNLLVDPLSIMMVLIVTGVGSLIHIYATGYMIHHDAHGDHPDRDYPRFFTFLNLFVASMLILVLGDNYLMMFIGWELVGACSYLLIGFWFDRTDEKNDPIEFDDGTTVPLPDTLAPALSAMKAFVVNRIGDVGFALGVFLIWSTFGTLQYSQIFPQVHDIDHAGTMFMGFSVLSVIAFLLFIGAMGKSAQIPLFVWLPDAMAGPTPVSALIHAATMVTAGIYMIVRSNAIFSHAPEVSMFIAWVGALTAFMAGSIAMVQVDLKRVWAYSTVSQLGYMFMGVGVGAYAAGMFHLTTHAFFKALLFLAAGSVMHALHDVIDIRRMGGLKEKLPTTYRTMFIGGLALAGFPLMSGFFSKDGILARAFEASPALWLVGIITASMTAFYTFRAIFIAFEGEPRDKHLYDHAHENPPVMTIPLWILAGLSIGGGLLGLPLSHMGVKAVPNLMEEWLYPVFKYAYHVEHHYIILQEIGLLLVSAIVAVGSIALAYQFYVVDFEMPNKISKQLKPLYVVLVNKYYIDEIYHFIFVAPFTWLADKLATVVDVVFIDKGIVDGVASGIKLAGQQSVRLQTGFIRHYALATFVGVVLMVGYFFLR